MLFLVRNLLDLRPGRRYTRYFLQYRKNNERNP